MRYADPFGRLYIVSHTQFFKCVFVFSWVNASPSARMERRDTRITEATMAFRSMQAEMVKFQGFNGDTGEAYYSHPLAAGRYPGIVVIHHFPGWDEWTTEVARKFAHHGYTAIAPSLYFRLGDGASEEVVARARAAGGM